MSLPILPSHRAASPDDLLRFHHHTELQWCRQLAEEEVSLDVGVALTNRSLPQVHDANNVLDASLPEGVSPAEAVAMVDEHFRSTGTRCAKWVLNPAVPAERTRPLADHLVAHGFLREDYDLMYLTGPPATGVREVGGLTVIPARASFRHARQLAEEETAAYREPQLADARMLHLEDPQSDSVLALKDGVAAAIVTVLSGGEVGRVEDVYVAEKFRRQGIGRTMMSRALEIAARSLFKHVFLTCAPTNRPAIALYEQTGFARIGTFTLYRSAQARP